MLNASFRSFGQTSIPPNYYASQMNQFVNQSSFPTFKNALYGQVFKTIQVPSFQTAGNASAPNLVKRRDNGAGSTGIYMISFPNNKTCDVYFELMMPHEYKEGSDLQCMVHWGIPSNGAGSFVHWQFESIWDNMGPPGVPFSTVSNAVTACPTPGINTISQIVTLSGVGMKTMSVLSGRFSRVIDVSDTYAAAATLLNLSFIFQSDCPGALYPMSKGF